MSAYKYYDRLEELESAEELKKLTLDELFSANQEGDIRVNETGTLEIYRNGNWEIA